MEDAEFLNNPRIIDIYWNLHTLKTNERKSTLQNSRLLTYFISNRLEPGVSFLYCFLLGEAYYIRYMKKFTFLFLIYTCCFMSYNEYTDCVDA